MGKRICIGRVGARRAASFALLGSLFAASCGPGAAPPPSREPVGSPAVSEPPVDVQSEASAPKGVTSSSGVPLEVLGTTGSAVVVRTPCGAEATLRSWTTLPPVQVVLDPGHGGILDTGATRASGNQSESDLNLRVVHSIGAELDRRSITWTTTRSDDYALLLSTRATFADALGARLMISVHHNAPASATSSTPGTEVYVQSDNAASARLGGLIYDDVMTALSGFDVNWTRAHDAGVLQVLDEDGQDAYGLLRRPSTPSVILEAGYLANPEEARLFATDNYLTAMGSAVAEAIETYLTTSTNPIDVSPRTRSFAGVHAPDSDGCIETRLE